MDAFQSPRCAMVSSIPTMYQHTNQTQVPFLIAFIGVLAQGHTKRLTGLAGETDDAGGIAGAVTDKDDLSRVAAVPPLRSARVIHVPLWSRVAA